MANHIDIDFEEIFAGRKRPGRPATRPPGRRWILLGIVLLVLVVGLRVLDFYGEWLWFTSLGQADLLLRRVFVPLTLFLAVLAVAAAWLAGNWWWAVERVARLGAWPGQRGALPPRARLRRWVLLAAVLGGALLALGVADRWATVLLYRAQVSFGVVDPLFGRDVAFHVFTVPLLRLAQGVAAAAVGLALAGAVAVYAVGGLLDFRQGGLRVVGSARLHLLVLAALAALVWAAGQWLARFELLYAGRPGGLTAAPGYTDAMVRLPAYNLLVGVGVVLAVLLLASARGARLWLPLGAVGVAVGLRLLLLDVLPPLVQRYRVAPDEFGYEQPYITDAITMTRRAHALDQVEDVEYDPAATLTSDLLEENRPAVGGVRLWDWQILLTMWEQLQEIRTYYRFLDVDVDRYVVGAGRRQVMIALRELEQAELRNPSWVNERLQFTHGFGLALTPVDEVDSRGQAVLWVKDIPPIAQAPFEQTITQPRIYFGQAQDDRYVIVGTSAQEFDYPVGSTNARNTYDGADGVTLSSVWRRLLFALRFGDVEILLSDALTAQTRILMHRNITDRVARLAPFLRLDPDPYPVLTDDGRLVWIYDAYTATDRYPYAQPVPVGRSELAVLAGQRYARNSVKVTVDAYDGTTTFYRVDPTDPIAAAWDRVFPSLFAPEAMPADLRAHWRYPEALFRAQAEILLRYHMVEPDTFYNSEDPWVVPTQTRAQDERVAVAPYYVTMPLRGETRSEFLLMLPFNPARKELMTAWLAARCDPPNYGGLVLYRFAKGRQVDGPQLVESRIDNDTDISAQLTLWSQAGSRTIRGNLLVIPVGDAILYVEPLFLQAGENALPELKRVIVASSDRVAMEQTLEAALEALVGGTGETTPEAATGAGTAEAATGEAEVPDQEIEPTPEVGPPGTVADLVRLATRHEAAAREALQVGDWVAFGREMAALRSTVLRLGELTGGPVPTATAPAAPAGTVAP